MGGKIKKVLSILLCITVMFSMASCAIKTGKDTSSEVIYVDEDGNIIEVDENGNPIFNDNSNTPEDSNPGSHADGSNSNTTSSGKATGQSKTSQGNSTVKNSGTVSIPAASNVYDGKTVELKVAVLADPNELALMNALTKAFTAANPKVKFKVNTYPSSYDQGMLSYIASKTLPDICWTSGDMHTPYSASGAFEKLNTYISKDKFNLGEMYDSMLLTARIKPSDSTIYFMPRDYNKMVTMYNVEMFDKAGVPHPNNDWTYTDFLNACKKLRTAMDSNLDPDIGLADDSVPLDGLLNAGAIAYPFILGFADNANAKLFSDSGVPNLDIAKPGLLAMRELVDKNYTFDPNSAKGAFQAQKAAMIWCTRPTYPTVLNANKTQKFKVDFASFPKMKNAVIGAGCSGYAISATSKNKDVAWMFIKYIVSVSGQKTFCTTGSGIPILKTMANDSSWRSVGGSNLNHSAWIAHPERDVYLNYANMIDPTKQKGVYNALMAYMYNPTARAAVDGGKSIDAIIADAKSYLNNALR